MSPRSYRIVLTCPFSKMADRENFDSGQKRTPLHGISLANFGGNLNFGPTLVPATEPPPVSSGNQPTATPITSRGTIAKCNNLRSQPDKLTKINIMNPRFLSKVKYS